MPKINGNEIRPGNVLEHNGGLWAAVKVDHVKPGKGGAFAQVELRNLRNGSKLNERFRSADKVERVRLEQKDQQFLYENDGMLVFMDMETYEQPQLLKEVFGEDFQWLKENGYAVVSNKQINDAKKGITPLPEKAVLLSFDDGFSSFYHTIFPLLKLYDYPATNPELLNWPVRPVSPKYE